MPRSVLARRGLPLLAAFGLLVGGGFGVGGLVEASGRPAIGWWLGPLGTALIAVSFVYSARKRGAFRAGSPRVLLRVHEALAWTGALAILIHAGRHVHALLPWLGVLVMLAAVTSGMLGELLLGRARTRLVDFEQQLRRAGLAQKEVDRRLMVDALAVRALEVWRVVHLPVAITFAALSLFHVATALSFH